MTTLKTRTRTSQAFMRALSFRACAQPLMRFLDKPQGNFSFPSPFFREKRRVFPRGFALHESDQLTGENGVVRTPKLIHGHGEILPLLPGKVLQELIEEGVLPLVAH